MPYKLKRPCNYPGCHLLSDTRFCPTHTKQNSREYERTRGNPAARGYNAKWQRLSKFFLARNPLCVECLKYGVTRPSEHAHHIIETSERPDLFYNENNLAAVCKSCHSKLSAKERGAFGRGN
jgi:5-methylcytosine-specific restriction protein A